MLSMSGRVCSTGDGGGTGLSLLAGPACVCRSLMVQRKRLSRGCIKISRRELSYGVFWDTALQEPLRRFLFCEDLQQLHCILMSPEPFAEVPQNCSYKLKVKVLSYSSQEWNERSDCWLLWILPLQNRGLARALTEMRFPPRIAELFPGATRCTSSPPPHSLILGWQEQVTFLPSLLPPRLKIWHTSRALHSFPSSPIDTNGLRPQEWHWRPWLQVPFPTAHHMHYHHTLKVLQTSRACNEQVCIVWCIDCHWRDREIDGLFLKMKVCGESICTKLFVYQAWAHAEHHIDAYVKE